ncbi:pyridoxal-phosphate dependent enzyme [Lewinella sp. IMCC34183]|uniref:pyridoxal-phosphate dependent enzyme n=1 Tax=Lewinella sp. IMCC34183 TaxID=2248762 RepID=UPI000E265DD6|nr:pyridoxal-phosphate dependent enzyme [Lewinella sp. IMCC34183]
MTLRDAVRTASNTVSRTARELALVSGNRSASQLDRITAFGQLIGEEIGDTWMRRSRGLERDFNQSQLFMKFEGENPTGTQKDRIAFAHVEDALIDGRETVSLATCGNYGVAVALACSLAGIDCEIFIPAGYHTHRLGEMERLGARIYRPPGTYEDTVAFSNAEAQRRGWYNANPGAANTDLQLRAYATIADEIVTTLGRAPDVVAVPVSNGTLLAGIHQGFARLRDQSRIAVLPRMVAASSTHKNPIVSSFRRGSRRCEDLRPEKIRETRINEPLINWHSFDGQEALDALYESGGGAHNVSDQQLKRMSTYLSQREALQVLPASTAGLIALTENSPADEPTLKVAVLTAKR